MARPYAITGTGTAAVGFVQRTPQPGPCTAEFSLADCPSDRRTRDSYGWSMGSTPSGGLLPYPHQPDGESDWLYFENIARAIALGEEGRCLAVGVGQQAPPAFQDCVRNAWIWSLGSDDLPYLNLGTFLEEPNDASGAESISIGADGLIRVTGFRSPVPLVEEEEESESAGGGPHAVIWEHPGGEDLETDWCAVDLATVTRACTIEGELPFAASVNDRGMVLVIAGTTLYKLAHLMDFDGNDRIDGSDLAALLGHWGSVGSEACPFDLGPTPPEGEVKIDGYDLAVLIGNWSSGDDLLTIDPICCESSEFLRTGVESIGSAQDRLDSFLAALGFETDEQFVQWSAGKSKAQLEAAVALALLVMSQQQEGE